MLVPSIFACLHAQVPCVLLAFDKAGGPSNLYQSICPFVQLDTVQLTEFCEKPLYRLDLGDLSIYKSLLQMIPLSAALFETQCCISFKIPCNCFDHLPLFELTPKCLIFQKRTSFLSSTPFPWREDLYWKEKEILEEKTKILKCSLIKKNPWKKIMWKKYTKCFER